ncbi:hypothetical protein Tco_1034527 [Tanacetum coccineum]
MHKFWFTINKHDSSYRFKIGKKRFTLNMEVLREIFQICPKLLNQEFDALPSDEEIVSFIKELGHKGDIKYVSDAIVDHMHQPWRTFASIINKCLSGKITGLDKMCLSRAQILWGIFVSKSEDCQVYGALLPEVMTNQKMRNSSAYKTYLAYVTGAATPKKARKFKKPVSLSKKRTRVTVEEKEPEPAKKVKKGPAKAKRSKGIDLLSEVALLEEAQLKKDLKRSKNETSIHQAGSSSEGADFESQVLDEPKGKSIDTSEGTGLKPGVLDVSKGDSSESKYESLGDSGDEANVQDDEDVQDSDDEPQHIDDERTDYENQETNDDEEETDDEFVHTPPNYVPTDDESNDVDDEEYDRIDKELYGNFNVKQTQEQTTGIQEESGLEMASVQGQYVVQATTIATPATQNATTEVHPFSSSHSVSSNYTSAFLNLENLHSTEPKVVSMLLSDLEKEVKELKNVDYSLALLSTIKSEVPNSIKDHLETTEIVERLRQQYVPQKSTDEIQKIKMEHARKQQVPKETITSFDTTALEEFDQKTTVFETMTKSKSFNKSLKNGALYHALMESNLEDEEAMDEGDIEVVKTSHEALQSPRQST